MTRERTRLYLISPPAIELDPFTDAFKEALDGGDIGSFQLRLKNTPDSDILRAAEVLVPLCQQYQVAFIMNDNPKLALDCDADGVHLGQDDCSVKKARAMLGEGRVIGVSCHDSRHLAMEAGENGADYVAFGAFHPTKSKSPEALAKYGTPAADILTWWQTFMILPCVAIGGITPQNCEPLARAGADFVAAITAVWEHPKGPAAAVAEFNAVLDACHG
ncbi:MAG: thiamine phosphate synthase [Proteobacteria bacterium]|nr:thiamine phosphate synthase [Pseudomonadota bacterium]